MIKVKTKGDFNNTEKLLERIQKNDYIRPTLERCGQLGVTALKTNTPIDTGITAASWYYTISEKDGFYSIAFHNDNITNGVQVAILIQYGHATKNRGWVEGIDYINPALKPIFETIANQAWREVTKN